MVGTRSSQLAVRNVAAVSSAAGHEGDALGAISPPPIRSPRRSAPTSPDKIASTLAKGRRPGFDAEAT